MWPVLFCVNVYAVMSVLMKALARVFCSLPPQSFAMSRQIEHTCILFNGSRIVDN